MPKLIVRGDQGVDAEVELTEGNIDAVGIFYRDDTGREWPILWVDNCCSSLALGSLDDPPLGDVTVYLHLGGDYLAQEPIRWFVPSTEEE